MSELTCSPVVLQFPIGPPFEKTGHFRARGFLNYPELSSLHHHIPETGSQIRTWEAFPLRLHYPLFINRTHPVPIAEALRRINSPWLGATRWCFFHARPSGAPPLFENFQHSAFFQFRRGRVQDRSHRMSVSAFFTDYFSKVIFGCPQFYHGYLVPGNLFNYNLFGMFRKTTRNVFNQLFDLNVFHKRRLLSMAVHQKSGNPGDSCKLNRCAGQAENTVEKRGD
jgi:hypothetical protein